MRTAIVKLPIKKIQGNEAGIERELNNVVNSAIAKTIQRSYNKKEKLSRLIHFHGVAEIYIKIRMIIIKKKNSE